MTAALAAPVRASRHPAMTGVRRWNATSMLTIYIVLLVAFPSSLTITALGAYGRPQLLWGVFLFFWWAVDRLQASRARIGPPSQPVRIALGAFAVVVLVGFAVALMRGQPADQVSPAVSALVRLLSWTGVVMVAIDGIRTMTDLVAVVRRVVIACALMAVLGIAQFVTGQTLVDVFNQIPGFSGSAGGIEERGILTRYAATATHPLEYGTALSAALPLAIALAVAPAESRRDPRLRWWLAVAALTLASVLAVSRSALIGVVLAALFVTPILPRAYRLPMALGGGVLVAVAVVAVPGLYGTVVGMFTGVGDDPSAVSRQVGIAMAPTFLSASPLIGIGFGTWLPRYHIFDNQWLALAVETGMLGVLAFAGIVAAAVGSAVSAGRVSADPGVRLYGRALAGAVMTTSILLAFFDGLSFPIAGGLLFLLIGLCGSSRSVALADAGVFGIREFTTGARRAARS